jgi:hypothetical protein
MSNAILCNALSVISIVTISEVVIGHVIELLPWLLSTFNRLIVEIIRIYNKSG